MIADRSAPGPRIVVVSGPCGVGKSETLRSMRSVLAGRVSDVAVLETDHFYMIIDPRWEVPYAEAGRYHEVSGFLLRETAQRLLRLGFDWIAIGSNGLFQESHVRDFAHPFLDEGIPVHHVTLDPGVETLQERMADRAKNHDDGEDEARTPEQFHAELTRFRERYGRGRASSTTRP